MLAAMPTAMVEMGECTSLHRVIDRHAGRDLPAGRVDVELDVLFRVLAVQEEQLRHDQVGDLVVDGRAEKDDALLQQQRKDVVDALAAPGSVRSPLGRWRMVDPFRIS